MWTRFEKLWQTNVSLAKVLVALVSLGALFSVNIYGYLSVLPRGFRVIIGPDFIFNYSLQFSMAVAMASLIGWQLGSWALLLTEGFSYLAKRQSGKRPVLARILGFCSLGILGNAKHLTLKYSLTILSFCILFAGFGALFLFLFWVELILGGLLIYLTVMHYKENDNPLSLSALFDKFVFEIVETDWKQFEIMAFVPLAIFFSLLFSNEIGEERARSILKSEPIFLERYDLVAIPFASSNAGLILAVLDDENGADAGSNFILIGDSGEELLRSFRGE